MLPSDRFRVGLRSLITLFISILPSLVLLRGDEVKHTVFNQIFLHVLPSILTAHFLYFCSEMIQHRPYTQKVDVYSFGIVLWELITGMLPFQNMTAVQAAFAVVNKGVRPIIPPDCLPVLSEIMTRCWDPNPDVRPPFSDVVKMLEHAETEIMTTVRKARFRCCITQPMTAD